MEVGREILRTLKARSHSFDHAEAYDRYQAGEPVSRLADAYGVGTSSILRAVGAEARRRGESLRPRITPAHRYDHAEAFERYQAGEPYVNLAREYGVNREAVMRAVRREAARRGVELRASDPAHAPRTFDHAEAYERYQAGESLNELFHAYNVDSGAMWEALEVESRKRGEDLRPSTVGPRRSFDHAEAYERYQAGGITVPELAREYGVGNSAMYMALTREANARGEALLPWEQRPRFDHEEAYEAYRRGEPIPSIAARLGVHPVSVESAIAKEAQRRGDAYGGTKPNRE